VTMAVCKPPAMEEVLLGVLKPEFRSDFRAVGEFIVEGGLKPASEIEGDGDFATHLAGVSVYFEKLGIVATTGCWKQSAEKFLLHRETGGACSAPEPGPKPKSLEFKPALEQGQSSWGVVETGAHKIAPGTLRTGLPIRVAVLDSGVRTSHQAFTGASIESRSFVGGSPTDDSRGHGTACAGILCGAPVVQSALRYSVAPGVQLFNGKIFDDTGWSPDFRTLAAIDWALRNGCHIISMSLGGRVEPSQQQSRIFDFAARSALCEHNALLVAGVGNDSMRPGDIKPVTHPANCTHILGVGAIDIERKLWSRSNGSVGANFDEVDLVAPGAAVLAPDGKTIDQFSLDFFGTSFATPFVAGIAALWAASDESLRGHALWRRLERSARKLNIPPKDAGAGLVQAP
jgi:subtilisin